MKVVFVLPPFNVSASWSSQRKMKEGWLPSLGVGYLAACLLERGHEVALVDAPSLDLDINRTVGMALNHSPDLVGISCLTMFAGSAYGVAEALKQAVPTLPVVMGGPHVTAFYEDIFKICPSLDVLFPGEAEWTFADFVDALGNGSDFRHLPGLVYPDADGKAVCTRPADLVRDLDTLPSPARDLYSTDVYRPLPSQGRRSPSTIILTSRGCPWSKCQFCYQSTRYGFPYRRRSPGHVIAEMRHLVHDLGFREIMFWDDNFCVNEAWVEHFCKLLRAERLDVPWTAEGHVRTITRPMLRHMAAAGCYNIFLGLESGTQEMLDLLDKGFTLQQARDVVHWAKAEGMEIRAAYILGIPTETPEMAGRTIRFACELNTDFANFVPFHLWTGTPIEPFALKHGRSVPWNHNALSPSYVSDAFGTAERLTQTIREAYRRYYFRLRFVGTTVWRMRHPSFLRRVWTGVRYWAGLMRRKTGTTP